MNDPNAHDDALTLDLLHTIEQRNDVSQRDLAAELRVALGLINSYLRRFAKKDYVKFKKASANRYMYYLAPERVKEKSRLTARFLFTSLTFYPQSTESCSALYRHCERLGWRRLVLCGTSNLADIAHARSPGCAVRIRALYEPAYREWKELPRTNRYLPVSESSGIGDDAYPGDQSCWA